DEHPGFIRFLRHPEPRQFRVGNRFFRITQWNRMTANRDQSQHKNQRSDTNRASKHENLSLGEQSCASIPEVGEEVRSQQSGGRGQESEAGLSHLHFLLPLPRLRERVGVRGVSLQTPKQRPSPYPLPEYREREKQQMRYPCRSTLAFRRSLEF